MKIPSKIGLSFRNTVVILYFCKQSHINVIFVINTLYDMPHELPTDTSQYILMLRITPREMIYSCYHPAIDGSLVCGRDVFSASASFLSEIERTVYSHDELLQPFKKVYVLLPTQRFLLVPIDVAAEASPETFFRAVYPAIEGEEVLESRLPYVGASMLSAADGAVTSFLRRTFGMPAILHPLAPLCEYFYRKSRVGNFAKVYVQLYEGNMEVVCFDKKGLLLANTFVAPTTGDAAYHLLNVWQQLGLNQQTDEVQIAGDAVARRELATLLRRYILTVGPVIFPSQRHTIGSDAMQLPFDLTALSLCEL